jgi:hypothetical protein
MRLLWCNLGYLAVPVGTERQVAVKQWLGGVTEQRLVVGLADSKIECAKAARAAVPHHLCDQLLAGAFGRVVLFDDRIEHAAEAFAADDAAENCGDNVANRQRIDFDQRLSVGKLFRCGCFFEAAHARSCEDIGAQRTHARTLLLEKRAKCAAHLMAPARLFEAHIAVTCERAPLVAHFLRLAELVCACSNALWSGISASLKPKLAALLRQQCEEIRWCRTRSAAG